MPRHEAATLPRARDGSISVESALSLTPQPYKGKGQPLLDAMHPETEFGRAMFLVLRVVYPNLIRVAAVQGHRIPLVQPACRRASSMERRSATRSNART